MSRLKTFAAVAALGLGAVACAPASEPADARPTIRASIRSSSRWSQRTDFVLDLNAGAAAACRTSEQQRLADWFGRSTLGYGDRVSIDEPAGYRPMAPRETRARLPPTTACCVE